MSKNVIAERITEFFRKIAPFQFIPQEDLYLIALETEVQPLIKNEILFKAGQECYSNFFVVYQGVIGLTVSSDTDDTLVDRCQEGAIIGLRPFFAKDQYLMTAKAREDSLVYAIPIDFFLQYITKFPSVMSFFLESFASNTRNPLTPDNKGKLISENVIYNDLSSEFQYFKPIKYNQKTLMVLPTQSVQEVAKLMVDQQSQCAIVHQDNLPIGIVTDTDLRTKIATGHFPIEIDIQEIMSSPVITVRENISISETQIMMLKHTIAHLCITEDGTYKSIVKGIVSEHDLVVAQANNPGILLKECRKASKWKDLKLVRDKVQDIVENSLEKDVPIYYIGNLVGEINQAIIRRAIELAENKMDEPIPVSFAWLSLGSMGRKEQLLYTDQDHALIFEDVPDARYEEVQEYFMELADHVVNYLIKVGYKVSSDGLIANNPMWCKSITDWTNQLHAWIKTPGDKDTTMNTAFFDFDFVYGNKALWNKMAEDVFAKTKDNPVFLAYLGSDAIKNAAPLGFFNQFLLETNDDFKNALDIKNRGITPLVDAGRLFMLMKNIRNVNNTYARFKKMAEVEPDHAEFYLKLADAFELLHRIRTQMGIKHQNNGQYIAFNEIPKSLRPDLKEAFQAIQEVQDMIKNRLKLTYFT